MALASTQTIELETPKPRDEIAPAWSFLALQALHIPDNEAQTLGTIRSGEVPEEIRARFPAIDFDNLPKVLISINNSRDTKAVPLTGTVNSDTGNISITKTLEAKNRSLFLRASKIGYLMKDNKVEYNLFQPDLIWSDKKFEQAFLELGSQIDDPDEISKLKELNKIMIEYTGLSLFEHVQAATHQYYQDSALDPEQKNYIFPTDYAASKTGISPLLIPLIIHIAHPGWHKQQEMGPPLLLPGEKQDLPLLPSGLEKKDSITPMPLSESTQIMNTVLAEKEKWISLLGDQKSLLLMVDQMTSQGFELGLVKKELAKFYLSLQPWTKINDIISLLQMRNGSIKLDDLPDWVVAERKAIGSRIRKLAIAEKMSHKVTEPESETPILLDNWMSEHLQEIANGELSITDMQGLFPEIKRETLRMHLRKHLPKEQYQTILDWDKNASAAQKLVEILGPKEVDPAAWLAENEALLVNGDISDTDLIDIFNIPRKKIYEQLLSKFFPEDTVSAIRTVNAEKRSQARQTTLHLVYNLFLEGLANGEYRSPASLARQFRISRNAISGYLDEQMRDNPELLLQREQAIISTWSRNSLEAKNRKAEGGLLFGGVAYDSYREAVTSLLLMLYTDYLPLYTVNFHTRHQDEKGAWREIDFKLLNSEGKSIWLEFGPAAKGIGLHQGNQERYMQERRALISDSPDEDMVELTSLREFSSFVQEIFGLAVPPQVSKKIGTFENAEVTLGKNKAIRTLDAIPIIFDSPELIVDLFDPERKHCKGLLNIFARKLQTDKQIVDRIHELYPDIAQDEFAYLVSEVNMRYQIAYKLMEKKLQQDSQSGKRVRPRRIMV